MKTGLYRTLIVTTLIALAGLLLVQIYWFVNAHNIQEKQFDTTINLVLRSVTDKLYDLNGNHSQRIQPVRRTSSNSFYSEVNAPIPYEILDSLIRLEFKSHSIYSAFHLSVYD